jgi:hypothetical protein
MRKILPFLILLLVFLFFAVPTTYAQYHARLRVIQASNVGSSIDPALRDVHGKLGSLFSFTSYRLLRDQDLTLSIAQSATVQVHPEVFIEITCLGYQRGTAELKVRVNRNKSDILNTQVKLSSGGTVLIGGTRHREGVVIYALSARF